MGSLRVMKRYKSLYQKVVDLTIGYYQAAKHIVQPIQVWGKEFISDLPVLKNTLSRFQGNVDAMHALVESGLIVPSDGGR